MKKLSMTRLSLFALLALLMSGGASAHAQAAANSSGGLNLAPLGNILTGLVVFIDAFVVPFVFALCFIVFLWGVFQYFFAGGADEEKRKTGRTFVMWGIIGFAVMISLWGLVHLLLGTFGFEGQSRPALPTFNTGGSPNAGGIQGATFTPPSATCTSPIDCPGAESCVSGSCQLNPVDNTGGNTVPTTNSIGSQQPPPTPPADTCTSKLDCPGGEVCLVGYCRLNPASQPPDPMGGMY